MYEKKVEPPLPPGRFLHRLLHKFHWDQQSD
jgi:hypothetical protein